MTRRFPVLVLGGSHPYARSMEDLREVIRGGIGEGPETLIAGLENVVGALRPALKAWFQTADPEALLALAQDRPPLEDLLPTMMQPTLLYVGEDDAIHDSVTRCAAHMPNATWSPSPA